MATSSSVLALRTPGMGEPGGLPFMGSHRVGHDWSDLAAAAAACFNGIPQILIHCVFIFIHFKILLNYHFIYFWLMGYSKVCHLVSKYLVIIQRPLWFWHLIFNFYQRMYFFITWVVREFVDSCFTVQKMVHFDKISKFISKECTLCCYWVECSVSVGLNVLIMWFLFLIHSWILHIFIIYWVSAKISSYYCGVVFFLCSSIHFCFSWSTII